MDQRFLIIIDSDGLVNIAQCFFYETDEYKIFPDNFGKEITLLSEQSAIDWLIEHIKPELIAFKYRQSTVEYLHSKYLKKELEK